MQRSRFILVALICCNGAACGSDGGVEPGVKVFKAQGSRQCSGGGTSPEVMKNELIAAGVEVRAVSCGNDGLMRVAVCGAPDGAISIFEIPQSRRALAESLGFAGLSTLPDAQITPCR